MLHIEAGNGEDDEEEEEAAFSDEDIIIHHFTPKGMLSAQSTFSICSFANASRTVSHHQAWCGSFRNGHWHEGQQWHICLGLQEKP
jgi:hypothetical protein